MALASLPPATHPRSWHVAVTRCPGLSTVPKPGHRGEWPNRPALHHALPQCHPTDGRHPQPPLPDPPCWSFASPPPPSALQAFVPSVAHQFVSFPVNTRLLFTQCFTSGTVTPTVCAKPLQSPPDGHKILVCFADRGKQTTSYFKISCVFLSLAALTTTSFGRVCFTASFLSVWTTPGTS